MNTLPNVLIIVLTLLQIIELTGKMIANMKH